MSKRKLQPTMRIGGRTLNLSNLDKVLWPRDGITKGDLIAYYHAVAKWLLPYLKDRPLMLQRFPDGIAHDGFYEKNAPKGLPAWVKTKTILSEDSARGRINYVVCNDAATLVFLANLGCISLHAWMSHLGSLDSPDFLLFDLDPVDCGLGTLASVAVAVRRILAGVGMECIVKSSGGSGLHVMVGLRRGHDYEEVRDFARLVALKAAADYPKLVTLERAVRKRPTGRVYVDWVQIGEGKTIVPPFVVRPRAGAPVSMPLRWADVSRMVHSRAPNGDKEFGKWNIRTAPPYLARRGDPWRGAFGRQQGTARALKAAHKKWKN